MGKKGDMMRSTKGPGDYGYGEYEIQVEMLREIFTVPADAPEEQKRATEGLFNNAVAALRRRMSKYYGFTNKYDSNGVLMEEKMRVDLTYTDMDKEESCDS